MGAACCEELPVMTFGRLLLVLGVVIAALGLAIEFAPSLRLGRLPGDLSFGGPNWRVYLPIGTSIVLSIVLTAVLMLLGLFARK